MTEKTKPFPSIEEFLFNGPLYAVFALNDDMNIVSILYGLVQRGGRHVTTKIDGFCPYCKKDSTFIVNGISISPGLASTAHLKQRIAHDEMLITCSRNENHNIYYYLRVNKMTIAKIGQFPSLADIAIDETRVKYRSVLVGANWAELYKAIGLAAHGEGIGSFVYLRRVFERLINSRFEEFKTAEGWVDDQFRSLRMDEKVAFLKDHLPSYLVEIRRIYSIFSQGIHELDNEKCLQFFDIGKRSIIVVLDEDLKKKQELAVRKELAEAVAQFSPKADGENDA